MKNPKNVIELRRLLAEKFPGVRMSAGAPERLVQRWESGIGGLDLQLGGGFARGALTEIISPGSSSGAALVVTAMIRRAHTQGEWAALIDGADCFDPSYLSNPEMKRFVWIRCSGAQEAIKAADLLLHDATVPVVIMDLIRCPLKQARRIPSSTWHRLSRTLESSSGFCAIFTPEKMVSPADARLELAARFSIEALDTNQEQLLEQVLARPFEIEAGKQKRFGVAG